MDLPQAVSDAQYNGANQLTRWAGKTLGYDLNGNLASDGANEYRWNAQNLLAQMVNGHRMQSFWIGDELSFTIPDDDWAHRIRQFSPYPESGLDELTYRRIGDDADGDRYVLRDGNKTM
ncbi:hypothetical protein P3T43_003496 [Paraburkholderia sp. GAS41]|uniref:hypothetical protein n=1 Tax=Paraburkholderia sp. GAS41 TaxID=3035134 RepID=UPI003D19C3A5